MFLLSAGLALAPEARADIHLGPVISYESFTRGSPESAPVSRWGAGARVTNDLVGRLLALEFEGLYMHESDVFASGNTFTERVYRGRVGLLARAFNLGPVYFGARGGGQYSVYKDSYNVLATGPHDSSATDLTSYFGGEVTLMLVQSVGLNVGVTYAHDKLLGKWVPEFFAGVVLR